MLENTQLFGCGFAIKRRPRQMATIKLPIAPPPLS
jgi:hypothetical protein